MSRLPILETFRRFLPAILALAVIRPGVAEPPASYSLANQNLVTPVKNQGQLGTCWAFSSTTVLESALVRLGKLTPDVAGNYLSEWDLATHHGVNLSLDYPYNNWGGNPQFAIAYFTRGFGSWIIAGVAAPAGGGPVLQSNTPLNAYPLAAAAAGKNLAPYLTPGNQPLAPYRVAQAIEFEDRASGPGVPPSPEFRRTIKQAILRYGALVTNMNANNLDGPTSTFNKTFDTYAYTGDSLATDHDVAVVGWNDAVPVYDKKGAFLGTGAWLIQNSWGKSFADSKKAVAKPPGYFWLGYMDTAAIKYCAAYVAEPKGGISDVVLQNQIFYWSATAGAPAGHSTWAATRLIAQTQTKLLALGLWTVAERTVADILIYRDGGPAGPSGPLMAALANVLLPERGYAEIPLPRPLSLAAGQPFYVVIRFHPGTDRPAALDTRSLLRRGLKNATGLSWISLDGRTWSDLAGDDRRHPGIFFLKGIQGQGRIRTGAPVATVTGLRRPPRTDRSFFNLRGMASFDATSILYRVGPRGKIRVASGVRPWKIRVRGLQSGRNVVRIWAAADTGVAATPVKVVIQRD